MWCARMGLLFLLNVFVKVFLDNGNLEASIGLLTTIRYLEDSLAANSLPLILFSKLFKSVTSMSPC